MISSIELQVISKILTSDNAEEVNNLCSFDLSYYNVFKPQAQFILEHRDTYGHPPDTFTFLSEFPDITLVDVREPFEYLSSEMAKNKQHILLIQMFNKIKDLGSGDVVEAWQYISSQCESALQLDRSDPMDIVRGARDRAAKIIEYGDQTRIPTGFPEIDKLMYGGLSTIEELLIVLARTNSGKTWITTRMMESAQRNGFPVLYYSPEMQAAYIGTRFDTWRRGFKNSELYQGHYDENYMNYIQELSADPVPAFVLEDKDMPDGVTVDRLSSLVKKHHIKLLVIDGLSYMEDSKRSDRDVEKYKNICTALFKLSKQYGCAVVVSMQANRATKESSDERGDPMPTLYNAEGSDHPGRIATQVFSVRQIFDKHILDIRMEKSRIANNQKPMISYAWDPNTGSMEYITNSDNAAAVASGPISTPGFRSAMMSPASNSPALDDIPFDLDDTDDEIVEF